MAQAKKLVLLPQVEKDGIGAAVVPSRLTFTGQSSIVICAQSADALRVKNAALKAGSEVVARRVAENDRSLLFLRPGAANLRVLWGELGISPKRMIEPGFGVELDKEPLKAAFEGVLASAGVAESVLAPRTIGINRYGGEVTQTPLGRVMRMPDGRVVADYQRDGDGNLYGKRREAFLVATNKFELANAAMCVPAMLARGTSFDKAMSRQLYEDMVAPAYRESVSYFDFFEEIEAQNALAAARAVQKGKDGKTVARTLNERAPVHSERTGNRYVLQQYSTPLTIAAVAQQVVGISAGDHVLEPTIGNGALVALGAQSGARITGVELDGSRSERAKRVLSSLTDSAEILTGDFTKEDVAALARERGPFDVLIANPPFETQQRKTIVDEFGRRVGLNRIDHQIVFDGLQMLDPERGRAFLVMPGTMMKGGRIDGSIRGFDNYLRATYEVAGAAVADGRLYAKSGSQFDVILYALGPRLERPLPEAEIVDAGELPVLRTLDELYTWGDTVKAALGAIMERRVGGAAVGVDAEVPAGPGPDAAPAGKVEMDEGATATIGVDLEPPSDSVVADGEESVVVAPEFEDDLVFEDDPFVVAYEPASELGERTTRIQKSLAGPTGRALVDCEDRRGPIDEYVRGKLGFSRQELEQRLSPEQIDALGLSFDAHERGLGFINADLMGVGKGRFLAAHVVKALREGRPAIFLTEKPNLFSDFVARDIADVLGVKARDVAEMVRPFIFNTSDDARVKDPELEGKSKRNQFLFKHDAGAAKIAKETGELPPGTNLLLSSYSQFQSGGFEWKLAAIRKWMAGYSAPLLIMDEAHRAAGETSRIGAVMTGMVEDVKARGGDVLYGSGTPLKSGRNIRVYAPALPDVGMPTEQLVQLIESQPLALQEALSFEMARMGTFISREMDQSGVVRELPRLSDIDPVKFEGMIQKMDRFAEFLGEMMEQSGEIMGWTRARKKALTDQAKDDGVPEKALASVQVSMTSPAGRFHMISSYLLFGFKAQFAEELVMQSLANGRKPVVVVDNTGDGVIGYKLGHDSDEDEEDEQEDVFELTGSDASRFLSEMPHMGDVLKRTADRMLTVTESNGFGAVTKRRLTQYEPWLRDFSARVEQEDFGIFTTSAIDLMRGKFEARGWRVGELTKRKYELVGMENGGFEVQSRGRADFNTTRAQFNRGEIDVLIMNRSASSGISMQASPRNGLDLRQREMIKLQLQSDITHERQIDGRIHRTGQVHPGLYTTPMSGLAPDDRLCQMFNKKNRSLTAASAASRENSTTIQEVPDLLNSVGEEVVSDYLRASPELSKRLMIDPDREFEDGMARKLLGRLIALPQRMQREVMAELDTAFTMKVSALDALGANPLRLRQYEWGAVIEPKKVLIAGDEASEQMAKKPLLLNQVTYTENVRPIRFEALSRHIDRGEERQVLDGRVVEMGERYPDIEAVATTGKVDFSSAVFDRIMNRSGEAKTLGADEVSVETVNEIWARRNEIEGGEMKGFEKSVIEAARRMQFLAQHLDALRPGAFVSIDVDAVPAVKETAFYQWWTENMDEPPDEVPAVVTSVSGPDEVNVNLGQWDLHFVVPGDGSVRSTSLAGPYAIRRDEQLAARAESDSGGVTPERQPAFKVATFGGFSSAAKFLSGAVTYGQDFDAEREKMLALWRENSTPSPSAGERVNESGRKADIARLLFDHAPGGEVTRKRYTLEGNIFAAVQLMGSKKLGEKVIYTAHDGELRNAMLLRNERLDKLLGPLDKALEGRTTTVSYKQEHLTAFLKVWMGLPSIAATPLARAEMSREIAMLISEKPREAKETSRAFEGVMADFDGVRDRLLTTMADAKGTAAIVLGGDPFGVEESPATRFRKIVVDARDPSKTYYRRSVDGDAVAFAAKRMGFSDMICVGTEHHVLTIANAKSEVAKRLGGDWKASIAGMRLTNKFVGALLPEAEAAEALLTASKAESLSITARGAFRGLLEGLTAERATLARPAVKLEVEREAAAEVSAPGLV